MPFQVREKKTKKKQRLRKWEACLACDKIRVTFTFSSRDWLPLSLSLSPSLSAVTLLESGRPLFWRSAPAATSYTPTHKHLHHHKHHTHTHTYNTKKPLPWLPLPPILSPEGSDPHHTHTHRHFYRLMGCLVDTLTSDTLCPCFDFFLGELCSSKKTKNTI